MPHKADHVADTGGTDLVRYAQLYDFPEFVKQANHEHTFRPGELAVTVYADPVRKQFPCHNAASTWLSALYFTEKQAEFHPKDRTRIQERLNYYVGYWGIAAPVNKMMAKHAAYNRDAESQLPDSAYAFVWVDQGSGRKERHLPLRNSMEVKAAAEYVNTYKDRFTFKDRHTMCKKILEKAARFGAAISGEREFLEKQAGHGVCNPERVVEMLNDRARLASLPALKEQIVKLAATVKSQPRQALTPEMLVKLAETVDVIDRGLGLTGKYTTKIPRPEDVIFEATFTKAASDVAELVPLTSGKIYKKADLSRLALDDVRSLFGSDFADEVKRGVGGVDGEKLAELASTLPRPDAELFDRLMADCGLHPQVEKAASVRHGFTQADFASLAANYGS
jgi:hypothetical protein